MAVESYRDLLVWQRAMDLVVEVYRVTAGFPREESYGLTVQLRRAATSVPSNIAEGQGRGVGKEFGHHVRVAQGSSQEMGTQLLIAERLSYLGAGPGDRGHAIRRRSRPSESRAIQVHLLTAVPLRA